MIIPEKERIEKVIKSATEAYVKGVRDDERVEVGDSDLFTLLSCARAILKQIEGRE